MHPPNNDSVFGLIWQITPYLHPRRKLQFLYLTGLMLLGAAAELLTLGAVIPFVALLAQPERASEFPQFQKLSQIFGWSTPNDLLMPMTLLFLTLVLLAAAVRLGLAYFSNRFIFNLGHDIGICVYSRILHQPYSFHVTRNTSEVLAGITKVQMVVSGVLMPALQGMVSLVIAAAILLALIFLDSVVALTSGVGFGLIYYFITRATRKRLAANSLVIAKTNSTRIQTVQEGLGGIRDVILDGAQNQFVEVFRRQDQRLRNAQAANQFIGTAPRFIIEALGIVLIVGLAYSMVQRSDGLTGALPLLGAMVLGAQRLLPLLQQIYVGWSQLVGNQKVLVDILEFLELPQREQSPVSRTPTAQLAFKHGIRIENLTFSYGSESSCVLKGVSLEIPAGSRVGFLGETGCGKTTLLDLIMGLLEPNGGQIRVDGTAICSANRDSWYSMIAHVPQSIFLSDATIAENVAFGVLKEKIDYARLTKAIEIASLSDFVETLPDGLATSVGERGIRLSGGQRQRIGIARAIYKQAKILVLDEGTSALDCNTEHDVMRNIEKLDRELTLLMIAHRLDTLKNCDFLVELRNGRAYLQTPLERNV